LGLFRRGRIDDATLDQQFDLINTEAFALHAEIEQATRVLSAGDRAAQLQSAEELLTALRNRLAGPVPLDLKRRIIEILVEKIQANTVERWGVQQSEIVITYRFSQPSEPAALVLPRSYRLNSRNRPPEKLDTLGDHLLRRRLTLKLLQRQVAEQLGVDKTSIYNWETNRTKPGLERRDHRSGKDTGSTRSGAEFPRLGGRVRDLMRPSAACASSIPRLLKLKSLLNTPMRKNTHCVTLPKEGSGIRAWTDDYSNVVTISTIVPPWLRRLLP
jgi:Helix-turn-helix